MTRPARPQQGSSACEALCSSFFAGELRRWGSPRTPLIRSPKYHRIRQTTPENPENQHVVPPKRMQNRKHIALLPPAAAKCETYLMFGPRFASLFETSSTAPAIKMGRKAVVCNIIEPNHVDLSQCLRVCLNVVCLANSHPVKMCQGPQALASPGPPEN